MTAPALAVRLTVAEAARAAKRHQVTIRKALEAGELHGKQRCVGGRWSIKAECLDAWLDNEPCAHQTNVTPMRRRA